jgi:hypothetical protein
MQRSGVEWSGVEWSGVEWSGVEWSGVHSLRGIFSDTFLCHLSLLHLFLTP